MFQNIVSVLGSLCHLSRFQLVEQPSSAQKIDLPIRRLLKYASTRPVNFSVFQVPERGRSKAETTELHRIRKETPHEGVESVQQSLQLMPNCNNVVYVNMIVISFLIPPSPPPSLPNVQRIENELGSRLASDMKIDCSCRYMCYSHTRAFKTEETKTKHVF